MESSHHDLKTSERIGDRSTSDVVVRIRTKDGRDNWVYCHSAVLVEKSKYFADRLSDKWPTCQILDSRNCVEIYCEESDFDYNVNVLRLLYMSLNGTVTDMWNGVKNALGILRVAMVLGCQELITVCVEYLEAVPWEEAEEEEIVKIVPGMGLEVEQILGRLQPVNPAAVFKIFRVTMQFATSSPPLSFSDLKSTAQEQLEYMVTEDDDAPLLIADEEIKIEVMLCVKNLFTRFENLLESPLCDSHELVAEDVKMELIGSYLTDISWACHILTKLEIMKDFVYIWSDSSVKILKFFEQASRGALVILAKLKALQVLVKVLEAIVNGNVVLPPFKRLHMVKIWLPFARVMKPLVEGLSVDCDEDSDMWKSLESAFVTVILTLPSCYQADILTEWLADTNVQYPDLTEAFEIWCYRSKVAKQRLASLGPNSAQTPEM